MWESSRGFSDLASTNLAAGGRTVLWSSTSPVPLRPGINHVRVKALGQPGAASFVNVFYTPQTRPLTPALGTTIFQGKEITYEVRDGFAIYQSDMILGKAADLAAGASTGRLASNSPRGLRPESSTIAPNLLTSTGLWPVVNGVVRIPYTNPSGVNATNVSAAIAEANTQLAGVVQWVPATASDVNLVEFDFDPSNPGGGCESAVGMQGGTQTIGGSYNCTTPTVLHEMGHSMGLFHEQSRADRNTFVNYMEQNIDKPQHSNFDIIGSSSVDSGLYNYASIMEYGPFEFARDGVSPVLETIPAGMVLSTNLPQYTTGDLDGIMRLYAHAPSAITVDTNPTGLQVIVDTVTCTAPCVFTTWAIGSEHTLSVPLDAHSQTLQTLSQQNYIFGRWNAGSANVQTVTVTNSLGNGTLLSPTTSPAITNYLASFIPVHPYNPVVAPGGDGTITSSPPPSSLIINGTATNYYQDRQLVTLTVNPTAGWTFYFWYNLAEYSLYANPYTFSVTTNLDYYNFDTSYPVTAGLYNDAVTTITAASPDVTAAGTFPGFAIGVVDGNGNTTTAYTPRNYDASGDGSGFASGANLTLCGSDLSGSTCPSSPVAQSPVTTNISYLFNSWSGAKDASTDGISVTVPASAGQTTYTANYTPSFRSIVEPSWTCGGNEVTSSPVGTNSAGANGILDAFFNIGTVDFMATAGSGMAFVGWSQDFSGTTNPLPFSLQGQVIGTANFNASGTTAPLTITSVSPATPTVTSGALELTVNGTGFTTNSAVTYTYILLPNNTFAYRSSTLVSSTQLVIDLQAGDISTAGYYQIVVLNVGGCNPQAYFNFPVANSAGPPVLGITKSHVGKFGAGQQNAQYTILVSNTGTGSTVDPVTVTETVPSGETLVSMSGSGWTCATGGDTCTRSDSLAAGLSYGAITVTVDVAAAATSPQVNSATVSGGGASSATATDTTTIVPEVSVPNVVGDTQAAATSAIQSSGLVVGTVTTASSSSVPSGDVISESPAAGTSVVTGSAVNLVVSSGPATTTVPNVVGDTQAAATSAIQSAGLVVGTVTTASSSSVPSGDVISESPAAGTSVTAGSAVNLVVSSGSGSATTAATYTGLDTTTLGTWTGKYGSNGYIIANDTTNITPSYATVSLTGDTPYTWSATTTSTSALQVSSGSSSRIASAYYSATSFNINLNLTDGNTHRIALYLLDDENGGTGRVESVTILNASTNAVLSTETYSSFSQGEYAIWNVTGNVIIQVKQSSGANAVVSGIFFDPVPTSTTAATYTGLDTTTLGTWTGKYGADGYLIASDATNPPSYAAVNLTGDTLYTFAASTTDPRALQDSSGSSSRIAAVYYSATSFNINVNLTDGNTHRIALYLLDWNSGGRVESVTILNASTNAVLSTETYSSFSQGEYAIWNVTGNVIIQVKQSSGANAVVSGIFFDPVPTSTSTTAATYTGLDTTTQGTWTGKYGADGYLIASDATNPPSYATVNLTGDTLYTFAASTTDPRALQDSSGSSSRIAAVYYSATSFNINVNLTDGNTHRIALYLLDWNSGGRVESVTILNASTNAVLSTETYSSFSQGEYAVWNVTGNVIIQVKQSSGANAVVSGIFFDPVPTSTSTTAATYTGLDTTTLGTWTGKYGSNGYIIANDTTNITPSYATVSFTGDTPYTWSSTTTSTSALQVSSGSSSRIASAYYSATSFNINLNLTDGNTHQISLYLLDDENGGTARAETISILNASTNAVLSTESFSSFQNGEYAVWNITGNVIIQVTKTTGPNAVVSGIFFN
jgi:hypothetical protein